MLGDHTQPSLLLRSLLLFEHLLHHSHSLKISFFSFSENSHLNLNQQLAGSQLLSRTQQLASLTQFQTLKKGSDWPSVVTCPPGPTAQVTRMESSPAFPGLFLTLTFFTEEPSTRKPGLGEKATAVRLKSGKGRSILEKFASRRDNIININI